MSPPAVAEGHPAGAAGEREKGVTPAIAEANARAAFPPAVVGPTRGGHAGRTPARGRPRRRRPRFDNLITGPVSPASRVARPDVWIGIARQLFGRTSNAERDRKKQTSNSRKKLTCPRITGMASSLAHAKASRTGGNVATVASTRMTRASTEARLPLRRTVVVCRSQLKPSCSPTLYGSTLTAAPVSSNAETGTG